MARIRLLRFKIARTRGALYKKMTDRVLLGLRKVADHQPKGHPTNQSQSKSLQQDASARLTSQILQEMMMGMRSRKEESANGHLPQKSHRDFPAAENLPAHTPGVTRTVLRKPRPASSQASQISRV